MANIRKAREDEILKISQLWEDFMAYNSQMNNSFSIQKDAKKIFLTEMNERFNDPDASLLLAEIDNELVGFCFCYVSTKPKYFKLERFGFIGDLYVKPEYRRQGIGEMLVNDAMKFFGKRRINQIELLVARENINTINFWEKLGFNHLLTWMYKRT